MKNYTELNARNIVNSYSIDTFILKFITDQRIFDNEEIISWFKKQGKKYLQDEYEDVKKVTKYSEDAPDWIKKGVEEGTLLTVRLNDPGLKGVFEHVFHYFSSLPEDEIKKIYKLPFLVAVEKANKWTEELNKKATIEDDLNGLEVVREYPDSFKWVKVFSEQALNREGKLMRHCVGSYYDKVKEKKCVIYSLRNEENIPKCTIEVIRKSINQIKGFANGAIQEKYVKYVKNFIDKPLKGGDYAKIKDLQNAGILIQDGIWYNIFHLPENFTVKKDLTINSELPVKLPKNLTVMGDFDLKNCPIETLPEGFTVNKYVTFYKCSLKELPKGFFIKHYLEIEQNKNTILIPKDVNISELFINYETTAKIEEGAKIFNLNCDGICILPNNFKIKTLQIFGNSGTSLPENLTVNKLVIETKNIELPKGLVVKKDLVLHYPLKYYDDLVVKGTIHCLFPIKKSEMDRHFMSNDTYLSNNYYMSNIPKGVNNVTYKDN